MLQKTMRMIWMCMPRRRKTTTPWQTCTKRSLIKLWRLTKLGSVHYLLSGLPTINWILRHTLLPKSGDHKMIRGHSINLLLLFDVPQKFKVMSLIVETIKRTAADQKRSCGYAPQIQVLINSKMDTSTYCQACLLSIPF